jgi:8-oxo-dGTP pyrophosphatase MutT (NUDIX family)
MINTTTCLKGCCLLKTINKQKLPADYYNYHHKYKKSKAGAFFYDPNERRVLLVQSRGMKWGPPKGTMEHTDKSIEDCAIREVQEETGILLQHEDMLGHSTKINQATYFYIRISDERVHQAVNREFTEDDDATGITWIRVECLQELLNANKVDLNAHCKQLLNIVKV